MTRERDLSKKRAKLSPAQLSALKERLRSSHSGTSQLSADERGAPPELGPYGHSPIVAIEPDGAEHPLFFMHPAGGNILCYVQLARLLKTDRPVYGLQSPGLYGEWEPHSNLEALAECYARAISLIQPQGPYFLGGWSMGGVVAYEVARQLRMQGHRIALLAMLDTWAVNELKESALEYEAMFLTGFAQELELPLNNLKLHLEDCLQLGPDDKLDYLTEQVRRANLVPEHIGIDKFRRLLRVYLINIRIMLNYSPQPYPGRITLLKASQQPGHGSPDRVIGWTALAGAGMEIVPTPGNHFTMVRQPQVQTLASRLTACVGGIKLDD